MIRVRNEKLTNTIRFFKGKYAGSNYVEDCTKNVEDGDIFEGEVEENGKPQAEPLENYGFGISAWLSLLRFLFFLFCLLSVLAVGLAGYYKSKGHLTGGRVGYQNLIARFSLGNIGSAQTICLSQFTRLEQERALTCEKGTI